MIFVYHTLNMSSRRNKSIEIMKMTKIAMVILDDSWILRLCSYDLTLVSNRDCN